jgi:hypothetical protein
MDIPTHTEETLRVNGKDLSNVTTKMQLHILLVKNLMSQGSDLPFKLSRSSDNKHLAGHSFLPSDDAKNMWNLTSTPLYASVVWCGA